MGGAASSKSRRPEVTDPDSKESTSKSNSKPNSKSSVKAASSARWVSRAAASTLGDESRARTGVGAVFAEAEQDGDLRPGGSGLLSPDVQVSSRPRTLTRHYEDMGTLLGHGSSGVVRKFRDRTSGAFVAVKFVRKDKLSALEEDSLRTEMHALMRCRGHASLLQLLDVFETPTSVQMVTEFAEGGDLFRRILANQHSEAETLDAVLQLVGAIECLHGHDIMHRDIKPENVLLSKKGDGVLYKLADFGLAAMLEQQGKKRGEDKDRDRDRDGDSDRASSSLSLSQPLSLSALTARARPCSERTFVGSRICCAPEVLQKRAYAANVDYWGLGVVMFAMLSCEYPFDNVDDVVAVNFRDKFDAPAWKTVSALGKEVVLALLARVPDQRLGASAVRGHAWVEHVSRASAASASASASGDAREQPGQQQEKQSPSSRQIQAAEAITNARREAHLETLGSVFREATNLKSIGVEPGHADADVLRQALRENGYDFPVLSPEESRSPESVASASKTSTIVSAADFATQTGLYLDKVLSPTPSSAQGTSSADANLKHAIANSPLKGQKTGLLL